MLSQKMLTALNNHVNLEMYSSYLYLSMAAYFEDHHLTGMSSWMKNHAKEEMEHAMKVFDYINNRNGKVTLQAIAKPPAKWKTHFSVFEEVYKHECKVTKTIHDIVNLAAKEKDLATYQFLQWYVEEQVEEEATALEIVAKFKQIKLDGTNLLMLDSMLGKKVSS